jgi:hypothetical protein
VRRHAYRKWIVFFSLMCQVLSATLIHVPQASASEPSGSAMAAHCPDHEQGAGTGDSAAGTHSHAAGDHGDESSPDHECKPGHCSCPCAHLPAMASDAIILSTPAPRPQLTVLYVPLPVQERSISFFRPPI